MKFRLIIITLCILSSIRCKAQSNTERDLFLKDTAIIYIGIINKFEKPPKQTISQIGTTKGVLVKINNNYIEIKSYYKGIFNTEFKTGDGIKKVVLVSERLNHR